MTEKVEIDFRNVIEAEAYDYGQGAYWCTSRPSIDTNPYPADTLQHNAWRRGYLDAHEDASE